MSAYTQGLDVSEAEGFTHEMIGRLVVLDIRDDSELGEVVTFEVELSSPDGTSVTDAVELTVVPHPQLSVHAHALGLCTPRTFGTTLRRIVERCGRVPRDADHS